MGIEERGKALEEAFFAKKNKQLMDDFKSELDANTKRDDLKTATGISDDQVLDELLEIGVTADSIAAVSLVPLVLVAWADGSVDAKERDAVLASAQQAGIKADSAAGRVLSGWLDEQPDSGLAAAWKDYVTIINEKLPAGEKVKFGEQLMARCKTVAEAAGGFLGLGSISTKEKAVLDMLESALGG